jgi:hypothetical protein
MKEKFDFDDILIQASKVSTIDSRKNINIYDKNGFLPLFTAPMDTVIDLSNYKTFLNNGIRVVLPRTINENELPYNENSEYLWFSYGLNEIDELFLSDIINEKIKSRAKYIQNILKTKKLYILIDIANAHMEKLHIQIKNLKDKFGDMLELMVGNISNPETYELLSNLNVWGIRCTVGNGSGCLTTEKLGVGYPSASLIKECYDISCTLENPANIIMDGGLKEERDFIKSYCLGANFCMAGGVFNKALESCAETYTANIKHDSWTEPGKLINQYDEKIINLYKNGSKFYKKFRGMSTKEVQKAMGKTDLKTSEGITRMNPVEYTLKGWIENFKHYLTSAMSYTNKIELKDFIGEIKYNFITQNSFKRFHK